MCLNTRTRGKMAGEPSAYSVFNPHGEAITGRRRWRGERGEGEGGERGREEGKGGRRGGSEGRVD